MLLNIVEVLLIILVAVYVYIQWKFTYWKRKGLPYHKPNFPLGLHRFGYIKHFHFTELIREQDDKFKALGHQHFGIYLGTRPVYIPIHPELIKNIMVKDFSYFPDRGLYCNENDDPLNVHLVTMEGQQWKNMRETLSPIFSSSKIKIIFEHVWNCSSRMISTMQSMSKNGEAVDMKEITSCYTTDITGSYVFGIDCNSCEDSQNEFRQYTKAFFVATTKTFMKIKVIIITFSFILARFFKLSLTPKHIEKFFLRVVRDNVEFREKNNFYRSDLLQLLINLKNKKYENNGTSNAEDNKQNLTMLELTAECFLFFHAGIQSSATTITFCLYELTRNLNIQEKLRNEINDILDKSDGQFSYNNIMEMKYLHQVVKETIRMYPILYITSRKCIKDYKVPNSDVTIEKGTNVFFPNSALHRDAEFFPEPDKFDPERFNKTNETKIRPFTYLPFGEGPRVCIASRLGKMQIKLGIAVLVRNFRFTLNKKSSSIKLDAYAPMLQFDGPAWFNIEKIYFLKKYL